MIHPIEKEETYRRLENYQIKSYDHSYGKILLPSAKRGRTWI